MSVNMHDAITRVEQVLGYTFEDRNCLWEALQAPGSGVCLAGTRRISEGNKRLALKGDAAIKNIIIEDWFVTDGSRGKR
jgi:ribonuclease III